MPTCLRPVRRPRGPSLALVKLFGGLLIAVSTPGCMEKPTEVVVQVYTDVGCDAQAAVVIGPVGELGNRPASAVSTLCDRKTGSLGHVVMVPSGAEDAELGLEVRVKADLGAPDECLAENEYRGCIVARRILDFIPQRTVHMRVDLRNPCINTPCDQTTSCLAKGVTKACVEARIDVSQCDGACDEDDQVLQNEASFQPCSADSNPCGDGATCLVQEEAVICQCESGHRNVRAEPTSCVEINECDEKTAECDAHATCTNTEGSYTCACKAGYEGSGKSCVQTECASTCGENATCTPSAGVFECQCDEGFTGDGFDCSNVDECLLGTAECDQHADCVDALGSYDCRCQPGYAGDGKSCVSLDECVDNADCAPEASCVSNGDYKVCRCRAGWEGDPANCQNTDDCAPGLHACHPLAECVDGEDSYTCTCPAGYDGDGFSCMNRNECSLGIAGCATEAICIDSDGGFECQCSDGWEGDGFTCQLACKETGVNYAAAAQGSLASAQSTFPGYDPANVIDGDTSTVQIETESWTNVSSGAPQWFEIDFGQDRTFSRVDVYTSAGYEIQTYDVWGLVEGGWQLLAGVSGNGAVNIVHDFARVTASRLQINCILGSTSQTNWKRLNEVVVTCH
jgi:hypothetical protein